MKKWGSVKGLAFVAVLAIFMLAGFSGQAVAQAQGSQQEKQLEDKQQESGQPIPLPEFDSHLNPLMSFIKVIGVLAVLLIIIYVLLRSSRKFFYSKGLKNEVAIQIRGSNILGAKKHLFVVEALGHLVLLGVTENQISVLLQLPLENLNEEQKKLWMQANHDSDLNFKALLNTWLRK